MVLGHPNAVGYGGPVSTTVPRLRAAALSAGYGRALVLDDIDLEVAPGEITALVGPNGSGKSTLLRALGRLLGPRGGHVLLDGTDIRTRPTRAVARELGLLPQAPETPEALTVEELVARGRFPHRGALSPMRSDDRRRIEAALEMTATADLRTRRVDELSGGQRQRAWIAMALAQNSATMLLDEPTTHLDLAHRVEVLDLLWRLNRDEGRTIVLVLHDLNEASRYADRIVALADGRVRADGPPASVLTTDVLEDVFGLSCQVLEDPETGTPLVVPSAGTGRGPALREPVVNASSTQPT